ncbi:MAG: ABC transporter ATP-binding protein [Melioribacteraceae bacterium]|nr:ABC transporter ATP-binding protein [Melioribacteraceae bacterium]MCF8354968.1 ABC transporter ATP-binding protein [Melioribacteraceae bacterium]MCF8394015.1 ABC transporter ATP-binding protein [Melioribacteraceae bacterium]MCF8419782.1 ABC transporter ATP-binding protein [Melioribacteraceae bacterium]
MININRLVKNYGRFEVLKNIDLSIEKGKINYIVGPNGSGKSTLIKIILGLVKPTGGEVFIGEHKINSDSDYRSKIGYMPQAASFPENLKVREVIEMVKDLRNHKSDFDLDLTEKFRLEREMRKKLCDLSGGTRQKVNAAIAFMFNPELLILDEPTAGLDPVSSSILKDKIIKERNAGKTIILTSHILSELEELADNVIFLLEGRIYFYGTLSKLILTTEQKNLERAIASIMNGAPV